jgi:sterol desaturase/sphingolipid hydroxylase (fatty acid hydroxylase superfamily)
MHDSAEYRVIDRKKFAVIMAVLLSIAAVGVWYSLDRVAEYVEHLEELTAAEPLEAAATLTQLMRTLAILNGIVLSLLAFFIIWHGWRGWRTESMPPKGSWILEGQRTWSGESAVRIAQFTIAVGVFLGVLALGSSLILWNLGDALTN